MDKKIIGKWTGSFIGLFIVLLVLMYFLYPVLKPNKAEKVMKAEKQKMAEKATKQQSGLTMASLNISEDHSKSVDRFREKLVNKQVIIDSLTERGEAKQQLIDSLRQALKVSKDSVRELSGNKQQYAISAEEASKSLLSLEGNSLGPIVNLLNEKQLIHLYEKGSKRQREKLLRTLDPKKAAAILKKVMQ